MVYIAMGVAACMQDKLSTDHEAAVTGLLASCCTELYRDRSSVRQVANYYCGVNCPYARRDCLKQTLCCLKVKRT